MDDLCTAVPISTWSWQPFVNGRHSEPSSFYCNCTFTCFWLFKNHMNQESFMELYSCRSWDITVCTCRKINGIYTFGIPEHLEWLISHFTVWPPPPPPPHLHPPWFYLLFMSRVSSVWTWTRTPPLSNQPHYTCTIAPAICATAARPQKKHVWGRTCTKARVWLSLGTFVCVCVCVCVCVVVTCRHG